MSANGLGSAALMGLIEGLTEYIPVSSTGHLILAGHLLRIPEPIQKSFDVVIQMGAILAVVVAYPRRFASLLMWRGSSVGAFAGPRGLGLLALTTLPAVLLGALAHGALVRHAFQPPLVAVGLAAGAVWMLVAEHRSRNRAVSCSGLDDLDWRRALGIGVFQCLALWPGVSRSAATILGGMALGLDRRTATEYSFFAAVPMLALASAFAMWQGANALTAEWWPFFAAGLSVSFGVGYLAIRWLTAFLSRHRMDVFAVYRLLLAALVMWLSR
ncbi:MAG: undecaprenyl-diphosphate phosphatase [Kiritimatiellae bacterium]|nr:undecaprenyl-diphosphate phosphatase [Kiritimatiellia bacterium]